MSHENVEIVENAYEDGWFDEEPERLFGYAVEDLEFVNPPEAVEPGTRRGKLRSAALLPAAKGGSTSRGTNSDSCTETETLSSLRTSHTSSVVEEAPSSLSSTRRTHGPFVRVRSCALSGAGSESRSRSGRALGVADVAG